MREEDIYTMQNNKKWKRKKRTKK